MEELPDLVAYLWWCTGGSMATIVAAVTKDDARVLAGHRFANRGAIGVVPRGIRVRRATFADVDRWNELMSHSAQIEVSP